MELFVQVQFWLLFVSIGLRLLWLGFGEYPRWIDKGTEVISLMIGVLVFLWAGILLWA